MINETVKQPKKKLNKKKLLAITLLIVLIAGIGGGTAYAVRSVRQERDKLSKDLRDVKITVSQLEEKSETLSFDLSEANARLTALSETSKPAAKRDGPTIIVRVKGVTRDSRGYVHQPNNNLQVIIVDLSVANESDEVYQLVTSEFKLKDSENRSYNPDGSTSWPPAANKVLLKSQSVAAGETVAGSISFANMPVSLTDLKLHFGDQVFDIVPQDATYPTWH